MVNFINTVWGFFTTPSKKIKDAQEQEKARLFLTLLSGVLPPGILVALLISSTTGDRFLDPSQDSFFVIYSLGLWGFIYFLARTRHYKAGVWLATMTSLMIILLAAVPDKDMEDFFFLSYVMIFCGLFFTTKEISLVYLVSLAGIFSSIFFHPGENLVEIILFPSTMVTIGGLLSVIGSRHYQKLYASHYEKELLQEAQFRTLLENSYDGIAEIHAGRIIKAEEKFARLFGYTQKDLIGKSISQIISQHQAANMEKFVFETKGHTSKEDSLHLEVVLSPVQTTNSNNQIVAVRNISERKVAEEELRQLALYDPVTGLHNRTQLLKHITKRRTYPRNNMLTSLLFLDIDDFKIINDRFGHEGGDEILREVGKRLGQLVRGEDIVARYGGDEYVIVCDFPVDDTYTIARRILTAFGSQFHLRNSCLSLTTSIGVVRDIATYEDVDAALRAADEAMYRAKAKGKNQFEFAFPEKFNVR